MPAGFPVKPTKIFLGNIGYDYSSVRAFRIGGITVVGKSFNYEKSGEFSNDDFGTGIVQQTTAGKFTATLTMEIHARSWEEYKAANLRWMRSSGNIFLAIAPDKQPTITYSLDYAGWTKETVDLKPNESLYISVSPNIIGTPLENGKPVW